MKFPTREQEAAHRHATIVGGAKGFFGGLGVALPGSYLLYKRWPGYQHWPVSVRSLAVITIVVPAFVIGAERAGLAYEETQWHDIGKAELDAVKSREERRWDSLTTSQKISDWAMRHEFSIIGTSWAASILGSYAWISRKPDQTMLMKLGQTRVWAQGMTLGVILAAGALTHSRLAANKRSVDHSWRDVLEQEGVDLGQRK